MTKITRRSLLASLAAILCWRTAEAKPAPVEKPRYHPQDYKLEVIWCPLTETRQMVGTYVVGTQTDGLVVRQKILFNKTGMSCVFRGVYHDAGCVLVYGTLDKLYDIGVRDVYGPVEHPYAVDTPQVFRDGPSKYEEAIALDHVVPYRVSNNDFISRIKRLLEQRHARASK